MKSQIQEIWVLFLQFRDSSFKPKDSSLPMIQPHHLFPSLLLPLPMPLLLLRILPIHLLLLLPPIHLLLLADNSHPQPLIILGGTGKNSLFLDYYC